MGLFKDLQIAGRTLWRTRTVSLIAVLTIALGIGASSAMFTLLDAVVLRPLPYPGSERLVAVYLTDEELGLGDYSTLGVADFLAVRDQSRTLERVAAYSRSRSGLALSGVGPTSEKVPGSRVTADFFATLGVAPLFGPGFTAPDGAFGAARTVVVSHGFWQQRLGGDRGAVGRTLLVEGEPHALVGVMPPGFDSPWGGDEVWPILQLAAPTSRPPYWLRTIGRLAPGATAEQASAELTRVVAGVWALYPSPTKAKAGATDLRETMVGKVRPVLVILLGAVGLLLLVAAVNVAGLQLARGAARERELAIRAAMGASRGRLARLLLVESLVLSLAGGALGAVLAMWGVDALLALNPEAVPRSAEVGVDARVLAFAAGLSVLVGVLFGLAPALRGSKQELGDALRGASLAIAGGAGRLRRALVVAEIALTVMLLVGAGLLGRSFARLQSVDPGVEVQHVTTMHLSLRGPRYEEPAQITSLYERLLERIEHLPGVEAAGIGMALPPNLLFMTNPFRVEGQPATGASHLAVQLAISPDFFRALGVPLVRGRAFDDRDAGEAPPVLIANQTLARRYFADADAVGKRIQTGDPGPNPTWETVVGVVGDVRYDGLDTAIEPTLYVPYRLGGWPDWSRDMYLVVRSPQPTAAVVAAVRRELAALDPDLAPSRVRSLEEVVAASVAPQRFRTLLMGLFAAAALLLALVGIYGVLAHAVTQRTREVGVRMALGARARQVVGLFVGQSLRLGALGIAIGLAAAFGLARLVSGLLFGVSPTDVPTYLAAAAVALLAALAACIVPAARASRVDPMVAMRSE
jgi:putative ABC transport system permease protein